VAFKNCSQQLSTRNRSVRAFTSSSHRFWRHSLRSRRDVFYTSRCILRTTTGHSLRNVSVQREPTGVTQEGVHTGDLFLRVLIFLPHRPPACGACSSFINRGKGSADTAFEHFDVFEPTLR